MKREHWIVSDYSVRPARPDGTCFYCRAPLGTEHNIGCVIRSKSVLVDVKIRMVIEVPEDWGPDLIEFARNESSWCASNIVKDIVAQEEHMGCMCGITEITYIDEASKQDEEHLGVNWEKGHIDEALGDEG